MNGEIVQVVFGGSGMVALIIAIISFLQNRKTLQVSQPKTEAEKMSIDIGSLRSLLAETRLARESDKQDFEYRIAELKATLSEQQKRHKQEMTAQQAMFAKYLEENSTPWPRWMKHHRQVDKAIDSGSGDTS